MASDFRIVIRDAAGAKLADVSDHLELAYTKRVNGAGGFAFQLGVDPDDPSAPHPATLLLTDKCQIEIWRRNVELGIPWYADFYGLYRDRLSAYAGGDRFTARGTGALGMLGWQHVFYPAGTANRSEFAAVAGESVLKNLVKYNATSAGTTGDGRHRNVGDSGVINGYTVTVETDDAGGSTVSLGAANANLLEALQKAARIAGGDFDLVKTGVMTYQFQWHAGQLGTDRSASVVFALEYDNMARPVYRFDRRGERTVAVVGGQGQKSNREYVIRTGPDYHVATNNIETFVEANDVDYGNTAGLNSRGDQRLDALRAREEFAFDVLQTPAAAYGLHYFLGDLLGAHWRDIDTTVKLAAVTVMQNPDGSETIAPEMETP